MTVKLVQQEDGSTIGTMTGALTWVSHLEPKRNGLEPDLSKPNATVFSVTVESDDDNDIKLLRKAGATKKVFQTSNGEEVLGPTGKKVINFTAPGKFQDGKPTPPPLVVDAQGKRVTVKIANGSEGTVQFLIGKKDPNSKYGPSTRFTALKVTKLIEYVPKNSKGVDASLLGLTDDQLKEATKSSDDDLDSTFQSPSILS